MQEIVVPATESAKKLENFLKKHFPIGYVRKLFRHKAVRLNGARGLPENHVQPGDRIILFIPFETQHRDRSQSPPGFELRTIFEDVDLLVIDKPAGLTVHEAKGVPKRETLLGMLENKYTSAGIRP